MVDVATESFTAYPTRRRTSEATYQGILQHAGRAKVRYAYIDGAPEPRDAWIQHRIPFETSAPYVRERNGLIESLNSVEIFGGSVRMEQAGAPLPFWTYAVRHFAFARNIFPAADRGVPYERRFQEGPFPGLIVPLMARIRCKQQPNAEKSPEARKLGSPKVWGVFLGWSLKAGGKWNRRYECAAFTEFIEMDLWRGSLRSGVRVRAQEVYEMDVDPSDQNMSPRKAACGKASGTRGN